MSEQLPSLYDLICEPDEVTLRQQTELYGVKGVLDGKFVRIGSLVLLTPDIDVERLPGMSSTELEHEYIIQAAFQNSDPAMVKKVAQQCDEALAAAESEQLEATLLDHNYGLLDTGHYQLITKEDMLLFVGKSSKFGRANKTGRRETVRLAQQSIGSGVMVG